MKIGDIVAFRVGIRRVRAFGKIISINAVAHRAWVKRLDTDESDSLHDRSIVNLKLPSQLKGKDKTLYHAFMLGVSH